jgi:hypothetical protein
VTGLSAPTPTSLAAGLAPISAEPSEVDIRGRRARCGSVEGFDQLWRVRDPVHRLCGRCEVLSVGVLSLSTATVTNE